MNIGEASRASGVPAKLIRYYEQIGLIRCAERTESNYRTFGARQVEDLKFIRRARTLGFTVEEIAELLSLWRDPGREMDDVMAVAGAYVADLQARAEDIEAMADTLRRLSQACAAGQRPDGP